MGGMVWAEFVTTLMVCGIEGRGGGGVVRGGLWPGNNTDVHLCGHPRWWSSESVHSQMLLNLHKKSWMDGLQLTDYKEHSATNEKTIKVLCSSPPVCKC